jgi:Zn-dependent oligopeptidase
MKNLLIQTEELPAFENINVSDVEPTIDKLLAESRIIVQSLLANTKNYNWDNLL